MRSLPLVALLAACTPPTNEAGQPFDEPSPATTTAPGRRAAPQLWTSPLVAGIDATFRVSGVTPGEPVFFFRSAGAGSGPCPPALGGLCLSLHAGSTRVLGRAFADPDGVAELVVRLPAAAAGLSLTVQAAVPRGRQSIATNTVTETLGDRTSLCPQFADPTVVPGGTGSYDDPQPSLAYAMANLPSSCTEIVLMPGTYHETLDYGGADLQIRSWAGAGSTILEPLTGGTVVTATQGETAAAVLDGITIRGGTGTQVTWLDTDFHGGGVLLDGSDLTIRNCIIEGNDAYYGGAVAARHWNGTLEHSTVRDNTTPWWGGNGGLYLVESGGVVRDNVIERNVEEAVWTDPGTASSTVRIERNRIADNDDGIRAEGADILANNIVEGSVENGIQVWDGAGATVVHNTVVDSGRYGILLQESFDTLALTVVGNVFARSGVADVIQSSTTDLRDPGVVWTHNGAFGGPVTYGGGSEHRVGQDGNFDVDCLLDADLAPAWGTPCVDGGTDVGFATDFAGEPRDKGARPDVGAREAWGEAVDCSAGGPYCGTACPVYVDPLATPGGDGALADPFPSVGYALRFRPAGCGEIVLLPGVHREVVDFAGEAVWLHASTGPDDTFLESGIGGAVIVFDDFEGTDTIVEGLTLRTGTGRDVEGVLQGGAVYCTESSPTLRGNVFSSNGADLGGALYGDYCDAVVEDNLFDANSATTEGSAIYLWASDMVVRNNLFTGHTGVSTVEIFSGDSAFEGNVLDDDTSATVVSAYQSHSRLVSNLVVGGDRGIHLDIDGSFVANNTVVGASTEGLTVTGQTWSRIENNLLAGAGVYNVAFNGQLASLGSFTTNNVHGAGVSNYASDDQTGLNGNISIDPLFVGSDDYHLQWGSLCIDAGLDLSGDGVVEDVEGTARPQGLGFDIGAYESW